MSKRSAVHSTFVIDRTYPVAPSRVFAAFANPEAKARWFRGDNQWKQLVREQDFRIGGRERLSGSFPNGVVSTYDCTYQDIVADERIVYCYDMHLNENRISVSLATIELERDPPSASTNGGTRMRYTEQAVFLDGYDDAGSRERGTRGLFDQLEASLRATS